MSVLLLPVEHELSRLLHAEDVAAQGPEGICEARVTLFPSWQGIVAEGLIHAWIIDVAMGGIACHDLIVSRIEYHAALVFEQVYAKALEGVVDLHQSEQGRHDIDLRAQSRVFHRLDTFSEDDEGNVVVAHG